MYFPQAPNPGNPGNSELIRFTPSGRWEIQNLKIRVSALEYGVKRIKFENFKLIRFTPDSKAEFSNLIRFTPN